MAMQVLQKFAEIFASEYFWPVFAEKKTENCRDAVGLQFTP
jgi:hypothetical protein